MARHCRGHHRNTAPSGKEATTKRGSSSSQAGTLKKGKKQSKNSRR